MKKVLIGSAIAVLMVSCFLYSGFAQQPAKEVLRITCWEGYADQAVVEAYKGLVKEKYSMDIEVKTTYATGQEDFYNAAKNGTADLISPPADMAKSHQYNCFEPTILLSEVTPQNVPNLENLLPFFKEDKSLTHKEKRYGVPYNCGPYGLAYNADVVKEAPASWNVFWDPQYAEKYTINNNFYKVNIWITALALGYPYDHLFSIDMLKRDQIQEKLNPLVKNAKSLWDGEANPEEFPGLSLATTWGFAVVKANQKGGNWKLANPKEGGTAWIDYWCITSAATGQKKKLCEEWINLQLSPKFQAAVVKQQGVSPVVDNVGDLVTPEEKALFHVGDNEYFKTVAIWQVLDEKTAKAFEEMWEEAKKQRS
ncbi:MAG TPA: extracellular solute-binding protein [Thermodesulfobacteriota bacterium]|nr:extracellular solute-binding protein [Thermodesulfobacteriota bacterium]